MHDFTSLFTTFNHDVVRKTVRALLQRIFERHGDEGGHLRVYKSDDLAGDAEDATWHAEQGETSKQSRCFTCDEALELMDFILDNAFVTVGSKLYRQPLGIPMWASARAQ